MNPTPRLTQSFAGRVREHLAEIEARLYVGVPRAGVLEEFKQRGIDLGTRQSFPSALYRARKSADRTQPRQQVPAGQLNHESRATEPSPAHVATAKSTDPLEFKYGAHDPRRIDEVMRRTPDLRAYAKLAKSESAPSSAPVPAAMATTSLPEQFKYGAHDPRRIDEVLRTPPDMKALAQVGRAVRDKKTP